MIASFKNEHGVTITKMTFDSVDALETYMLSIIGAPQMKGKSTKAIGTALLIWERKQS